MDKSVELEFILLMRMDKTGHYRNSLSLLSHIHPKYLQLVIKSLHHLEYFLQSSGVGKSQFHW
ncbi:MAG: hypothetical protein LBU03_01340 [Tannerellaceae bacterium]|nr:hypothetical protein [Tannerellaceae bacterium]